MIKVRLNDGRTIELQGNEEAFNAWTKASEPSQWLLGTEIMPPKTKVPANETRETRRICINERYIVHASYEQEK